MLRYTYFVFLNWIEHGLLVIKNYMYKETYRIKMNNSYNWRCNYTNARLSVLLYLSVLFGFNIHISLETWKKNPATVIEP